MHVWRGFTCQAQPQAQGVISKAVRGLTNSTQALKLSRHLAKTLLETYILRTAVWEDGKLRLIFPNGEAIVLTGTCHRECCEDVMGETRTTIEAEVHE